MTSVRSFYDQLTPYLISDAQLRDNEYPIWFEEGREVAVVQNSYSLEKSPTVQDGDNQRICRRCWLRFDITKNVAGECVHHPQRASRNKGNRNVVVANYPLGLMDGLPNLLLPN